MQPPNEVLLSFTETSDTLTSNQLISKKKSHFKIKRIFVFVVITLVEILLFFQRACPTVVTDDLSKAYDVPVSQLGIFTSMFYYPYALFQPFAGLLSDVMEPAYIISSSVIIAAIGDVICGLSKSIYVGCIGRFIVGMGCGPIYTPCNRIILNWFPLEHYSKILGLFIALAGCGGILAQTPLTLMSNLIGWRWCFHIIAIVSAFFSLLILFFVRGNPVVYGYPAVNESLSSNANDASLQQKYSKLMQNLKTIITNSNFWIGAIFVFFSNGSFYNVTGIWGGPYLKDMLGYDSIKASNALLGLSIGANVGSLINPFISDIICRSKKLTIILLSIIAIICCIPLAFYTSKLSFAIVIILFAVFAMSTNGVISTMFPMCVELFHPAAGSSVGGCLNCFAFLSLIIFMPLTGQILDHFGTLPDNPNVHNPDGFKYGLWVFNICGLSIGVIILLFFRKLQKVELSVETLTTYDPVN